MAEYDFSTLNATDLEELTCDLINMNQTSNSDIKYKTFKEGKDKGIDFLYSTEANRYEHVGQVKHYLGTGYSGLLATLKSKEVDKVKLLCPNKYIVATSVDLSVSNTEEIQKIFNPFIKTVHDIYGKKDLNRLIESYPEVLNIHFKLWFSDTTVLQKLLNSNLEYRSVDFLENEVKKRLLIYVKTKSYPKARESLKSNKFIVITGEPGVGKTTLAEVLAYEYIKEGYDLIYVYDSIKEADSVLSPDNSKQIIYYDDFLGSNNVEINKAKESDTILNKVLRRVKNSENKVLILTTRKHILNSALQDSENLKRSRILKGENILHLDEYSDDFKSSLIKNHIENSNLPSKYKDLLSSKEIFDFILNHKFFTPRSVEYITNEEVVGDVLIVDFKEFIKESFNNPTEIWKHAYINQLYDDDRLLLNTLVSFSNEISINRLQLAFEERIQYEVDNNNKIRSMNAFNMAFNRLNGGFIYSTKNENVRFINPSLIDFLLKYIESDPIEIKKIAETIININQLSNRLFTLMASVDIKLPINIQNELLSSHENFLTGEDDDAELISLALVIYKHIEAPEKEKVVCRILNSIDEWESLYEDYELSMKFQEFMSATQNSNPINQIIQERITEILDDIVLSNSDFDGAYNTLSDIVAKYDLDLDSFETNKLDDHFAEILQDYLFNEVEWLTESAIYEDEVSDVKNEIEAKLDKINSLGLNVKVDFSEFDNYDWWEITSSNDLKRIMDKDD